MAFFDPVDPSTESLLWPGRVGFCIVAHAATWPSLPLRSATAVDERPGASADVAACSGDQQ
jgi:hypothetical protein